MMKSMKTSSLVIQIPLWDDSMPTPVVNVASVVQRSPFRYPGGKTWLVPRIGQWLASLPIRPTKFIEPFAGGAAVGLTVAFEQLASLVILVERDEQVAAVWHIVINTKGGAEWLAKRIVEFHPRPKQSKNCCHRGFAQPEKRHFKPLFKIESVMAVSSHQARVH